MGNFLQRLTVGLLLVCPHSWAQAQTFNGEGGLLVPPGAPAVTIGITNSNAVVSGVGVLGQGCNMIDNVTLDLNHTFVGDIAIFLYAPSGEVLELSSNNGGSGDNFKITVFKDNTANFITTGAPPYNGTFRPEGRQNGITPPFPNANPPGTFTFANTFNGVNADGTWILQINDHVAIDVGILNAWSITFTSGGGPAPMVTLGNDITVCPGQVSTLTATVNPSADTYLWSTGATTPSINVSPATTTTYMVTVTNNGCIDADTIQVVVNPNAVVAEAGPPVTICEGLTTTLTGSGGSTSATYTWSTGQTGTSITVSPTGTTTYTLTVTDGGCSDTDQVVVTVTPQPNADAGPPVTICDGQSASLTASGGTNNNHYTWSTGQTGQSINVTPVTTTTYTVTVNIGGCTDTDDVTVTVEPSPTVDAGPNVQICAGESVDLSAVSSAPNYVWSTGQTGPDITVSPPVTTTYTVTVTDGSCFATDNVTVTVSNVNAGITPDQEICEGESVTLTASGGSTYVWSTGQTSSSITVSPTTLTTYTVTVSQGGCTDEADVTVTVNDVPTANVTPGDEICAGETVQLVASGGGTYQWSNGQVSATINVSPNTTTTYTVTVTDNGCTSSSSAQVIVHPAPNTNAGFDESICDGESVTLTATGLSGPGTYEWSTGDATPSITVTPLNTTTYFVTITNEFDCSSSDHVTVTVNPIPVANAGPDVAFCEGESATLTASGGAGASTYQWSTGQSGASIVVSPNAATVYTVTVTVAGCSDEDEVEVDVLPTPFASAGTDEGICNGATVTLTASGGGTYQWSNGQSTETINVTPATTTTYTVTVTAANGCTDEDEVEVEVFPGPLADAGPDISICDGESGTLVATGGGAYEWSTGQTTSSINVSPIGTTSYSLTVTDANGCSDTDIATVIVNSVPVANAGVNVFIVAGESTTLTASGGGAYEWSTGETTQTITVMPGSTTTYTVTVTMNGCSDSDDVTVFVNEAPSVDLGPDVVICEGETATLDASISGPFNLVYEWSTGAGTNSITVMPAMTTSYSVTATDNITGLSSIDTILVTVLALPVGTPVISGALVLCEGSISTYSVNPLGSAVTYTWTVPAGATIVSGQGTTSIEVNWGSSMGGTVEIVVSNSCGSLPAVTADVIINTAPLLAGPVTGPAAPCADGSGSYAIASVAGADSYQWTVIGGALITSGQGTPSVMIDWNGTAGGDVCVTAANACGSSASICLTVTTTSIPVIDAGADQQNCGLEATMAATGGSGTWSLIDGPGTPQFSDPDNPGATVQVSLPGTYTFSYANNENGCEASDEVVIIFNDVPLITNVVTDCDDINASYVVSFEITGGASPFIINGNSQASVVFTSTPIVSGEGYTFQVTDANGCVSQEVSGSVLCSCTTTVGSMDLTPAEACVDGTVTAEYLGGEILDGNDKLAFIIHDGTIPGGIIAWNDSPVFGFVSPMLPEVQYFISAVTGDEDAGGLPSIADPCLSVSTGTPVKFHDFPNVVLDGDTIICEGSCTDLIITSSGTGPLEINYTTGTDDFIESGFPGTNEIQVCPLVNTIYTIVSVTDQFCTTSVQEDIKVDVRENLFSGIPDDYSICAGVAELISLPSLLTDADPGGVWSETSTIPSGPGAFDPLAFTFNTASQDTGIYLFEYALPGLDGCPGSVTTIKIEINPLPNANAGADQLIGCDPSGVTLDGSGSTPAGVTYHWTTIGGSISGSTDLVLLTATSGGKYILEVTDPSTGCTSSDTVQLTAQSISLDGITINIEKPLCPGDCNGIVSIQNTGAFLIDFGDGNFVSDPVYEEACSGTLSVVLMDEFGCVADTSVQIDEPEALSVDLGPDLTVSIGDSIQLTAGSSSANISYNWFGASLCTTCSTISILPSQTTYFVEIRNENGCVATDEIHITIDAPQDIFIPTAFSPNNDGINDYLTIAGSPDLQIIKSLEIFDRWGNEVYEAKDFLQARGWDGTFRGKPVTPGVYVYRLDALFFSGDELKLTGDITVIR